MRSRTRRSRARLVAGLLLLAAAAGCRQDMHNQPKYKPLRASAFYPDRSSARPIIDETVPRGALQEDVPFFTGKQGTTPVAEIPFAVDAQVLRRGQERYTIFCSPCHDATGGGLGMVVQRGYRQPPSLHDDRLRSAPAGHYFDVITNGFGAMPPYRAQVPPDDRWAITAYIRALQLSQRAAAADVPGGDPATAKPAGAAPAPAGH